MAKGKYEYWLTDDGLLLLRSWTRKGLTDDQIAKKIDISCSTLYEWKKKYSEISEALKRGKEVVDFEVENALLSKALGITKIIQKPIKIKEVLYDNGKRISEKESIVYCDEEIYIPPDTTAQIFWLKNRQYESWRDKRDIDAKITADVNNNNPFKDLTTDELRKLIKDE